MVTKRTLALPVVLTGIALLAGCGPPPREPRIETISMFADALVYESSNGAPTPQSTDYTGLQALEDPNVTEGPNFVCQDDPRAWSPAISNPQGGLNTFEWDDQLVLEFPNYVYVREIRIYESYNPGAIVAVDMERDDSSDTLVVFEDQYGNGVGAPCPSSFNIEIEENGGVTPDQWNRVAIYIDGDLIGDASNPPNGIDDDWPEIDAVEIIGDILVD